MCTILECLDGTVIESCGELREAGYDVPHEWVGIEGSLIDLAEDDTCMCNIDVLDILAQQPQRLWEQDPFGYTEVENPKQFR